MHIEFTKALFKKVVAGLGSQIKSSNEVFVGAWDDGTSVSQTRKTKLKQTDSEMIHPQSLADLLAFQGCDFVVYWNLGTTSPVSPDVTFASDTTKMSKFAEAVQKACELMGMTTKGVPSAQPLTLDVGDFIYTYYAMPIFID